MLQARPSWAVPYTTHPTPRAGAVTSCLANLGAVEDEYYFMLNCPLYIDIRESLLKNTINKNPSIKQLDQKEQLVWPLNSQDREVILAVAMCSKQQECKLLAHMY